MRCPAVIRNAPAAVLLGLVASCATSHPDASSRSAGRNNVVTSQTQNVQSRAENSQSKLLIRGENNLVEIKDRNSSYTSRDDQSVTILEGSNNHLSYDQEGNRGVSEHRRDTLIIRADGLRGAYQSKNQMTEERNTTGTTIIDYRTRLVPAAPRKAVPLSPTKAGAEPAAKGTPAATASISRVSLADEPAVHLNQDLPALAADLDSAELVLVPPLNRLLPVADAVHYYGQQAQAGNVEAFYQLGKLFQAGHGDVIDLKRALNYYEVAARHNHGGAALTLAQLYEEGVEIGGTFAVEPNAEKARYYYVLAEKNGAKRPAAKPLGRW